MYRRPLDMYLNCISSVVFGALGRLVSLCIVSLYRHVSLPVPGAFICSVFKPVSIHAAVSTFFNTERYEPIHDQSESPPQRLLWTW